MHFKIVSMLRFAAAVAGTVLFALQPDLAMAQLVTGDYNQDGRRELADYTVWRDALDNAGGLPNDVSPGFVDGSDFIVWRLNYDLPTPKPVVSPPDVSAVGNLSIEFRDNGVNAAGNRETIVSLTPALVAGGTSGSLAVELGLRVTSGTLFSANTIANEFDTVTPGANPFGGSLAVTSGVIEELIAGTVFVSAGSSVVQGPSRTDLLVIETANDTPATIAFGSVATGDASIGAVAAYRGVAYSGFSGAFVAVPEPATSSAVAFAGLGLAVARRGGRG